MLTIHRLSNNHSALLNEIIRVLMGVVLLFACSQLSIPLEPIPISLQTVGVMLIALLYSMHSGISSIIIYLTGGALGLPLFAGYSAGLSAIYGVSGGYLIGFLACIYTMNKLKKYLDMQTTVGIFLNCMAGTVVIFMCGISWLASYLGWHAAITNGLLPFIIPGCAKAILLTMFLRSLGIIRAFYKS